MTYQETLQWMFNRLPMYQQQGKTALKPKLDNIREFCRHLGNPENRIRTVHVAGTNGKGSVSHMLASILQEAGYKTGLYTSPHLKDFRERIKINGIEAEEDFVVNFIKDNKPFLEEQDLSFFEMTVGMAFDFFARKKVDIAIIEVGLGGRLDSTNIITPEISVITNIGYDHTDILGDTLEKIAFEKAGIIKPGVPVVISEYQAETFPVFRKVARDNGSELFLAEDLSLETIESDLLGIYQKKNIRAAIATARHLKRFDISEENMLSGLIKVVQNTGLKGRWQQLRTAPKVICDTAHNAEGLRLVMHQIESEEYKNLHIVLGVVRGKDLNSILPLFPQEATYYFASPAISRALPAEELRDHAQRYGLTGNIFPSVKKAYNDALAKANKGDFIYIGGSTFVVAEIL
ncbi:bifunctional folylpolyglutamate synthase/dihydrofolate synthase [Sinomicrobium weinanense]|uniref:Dihydrofolate synthase/folylpolyglutamate synthase n=1 Tax=Sinomicrobium weinanense TaxID=2842200 RepID=A0A926JTW4_9FLAO|nr:folylpolyglutamate synthase/dihydrofolate synthase family protein [Sinomicrobium weinanense]MBC9797157.1 bifunctional folylpolyglutamate synthase/dihydrofolate synthase [Sinomicrobium weinanense]MBU3124498.1 bifunctional folylpolyglutamate synthase/dihydrofolate synthase [Sinomicrobium weinanense]